MHRLILTPFLKTITKGWCGLHCGQFGQFPGPVAPYGWPIPRRRLRAKVWPTPRSKKLQFGYFPRGLRATVRPVSKRGCVTCVPVIGPTRSVASYSLAHSHAAAGCVLQFDQPPRGELRGTNTPPPPPARDKTQHNTTNNQAAAGEINS
jgi:hypothetical protein